MATKAVDGITHLAQGADSESVQLRAWRAILADMMSVAKFSDLEYRMAEIEEQLEKKTGYTPPVRVKARPPRDGPCPASRLAAIVGGGQWAVGSGQ